MLSSDMVQILTVPGVDHIGVVLWVFRSVAMHPGTQ
jgi:hypothetical protein